MSENPLNELNDIVESISPSSLIPHMIRSRPYDGQCHTTLGERGSTEVEGLTYRDVYDCMFRGAFDASGLPEHEYPASIFNLPWNDMDIIAVFQNAMCWMEKYQGIYPNVPELTFEDVDG